MNIKYPINYSGYIPILRSILLLLKNRILSLPQLGSYIFLVMQADFDKKHRYYGAIIRDDKQLADAAGVNQTTIYRHRKELIQSQLLFEENGVTRISDYRVFELDFIKRVMKHPASDKENLFLVGQESFEDLENPIANLHNNQDRYDL